MTYARKTLVSLNDTPYYHVVARCVRRAWLWGFDEYAGRDYSHRKEWVLERLAQLTSIFTIEIPAYAVMSNHYHLVVYVDQTRARELSREQVVERWTQLFRAPPVVERWCNGKATQAERQLAEAIIHKWRKRLCDLSWFMKCLNEHLARRANLEDNCDGRFWQGRFRSQALLDEAGILTAMAYVDLNPVRAGIASTPEDSAFTSIYERIRRLERECRVKGRRMRSRPHLHCNRSPMRREGQRASHTRSRSICSSSTGRAVRFVTINEVTSMPSSRRSSPDSTSIQVHGKPRCSRAAMSLVARWGGSTTCRCTRRRLGSLGCEGCARRSCSIGDLVSFAVLSSASRSLIVS